MARKPKAAVHADNDDPGFEGDDEQRDAAE